MKTTELSQELFWWQGSIDRVSASVIWRKDQENVCHWSDETNVGSVDGDHEKWWVECKNVNFLPNNQWLGCWHFRIFIILGQIRNFDKSVNSPVAVRIKYDLKGIGKW